MFLYYIYPLYTGTLAIILYLFVPQKSIRSLFIYGIIFGAVMDFIAVVVFTLFLGVGGYINYEPFGFMGIQFFPLIAWLATLPSTSISCHENLCLYIPCKRSIL